MYQHHYKVHDVIKYTAETSRNIVSVNSNNEGMKQIISCVYKRLKVQYLDQHLLSDVVNR